MRTRGTRHRVHSIYEPVQPHARMPQYIVCMVSVSCSTNSAKSHTNAYARQTKTFYTPSRPAHKYACTACVRVCVCVSVCSLQAHIQSQPRAMSGSISAGAFSGAVHSCATRPARCIAFNENSSNTITPVRARWRICI